MLKGSKYYIVCIVLGLLLVSVSCKDKPGSATNSTTTTSFIRETPVQSFYTRVAKDKVKQLELDSLESGFKELQIRIWYDHSLFNPRELVVITNRNNSWTATLYELDVEWKGDIEKIENSRKKDVTPKSGWTTFVNKLLSLQILSLPDQDKINGYGQGVDGTTYNFEIATKNQYRFYSYWEPKSRQKFWQARNVVGILSMVQEELWASYF